MPRLDTDLRRIADQTAALRKNLSPHDPLRQRLTTISDRMHALARLLGSILDRFNAGPDAPHND